MVTYPYWQDPNLEPYKIWRDNSACYSGHRTSKGCLSVRKHTAWYFTLENKDYGPYPTRQDAEKAAFTLAVK